MQPNPQSFAGQRTQYSHAAALWSRTSAREIVLVIAEEAEAGRLPLGVAMELIDRVWARSSEQVPGDG